MVRLRILAVLASVSLAFIAALFLWDASEDQRIEDLLLSERSDLLPLAHGMVKLVCQPAETLSKDYTYWEEMVDFTRTLDATWAGENLETCLSTYTVDAVWVFDLQFRQKHVTLDPKQPALRRFPLSAAQIRAEFSNGPFAHFHIPIGGDILAVWGASIHRSADSERKGKKFGYFLVGRLWTKERVTALARLLDCEASIGANRSDASGQEASLKDAAYRLSLHMNGPGNSRLAWLNFEKLSQSARAAHRAAAVTMRWMVALVAVFLAVLFLSLYLWMAAPLQRLTLCLERSEPESVLGLAQHDHEFGRLARMVLSSFEQRAQLEEEIEARSRAQEDLARANEQLSAALAEAEELTRAAQAAATAKSEFLSNMGHELRTPLNGVIGMSDLLLSSPLTEEQNESVSTIAGSARHLLAIIDDILDLSKIEADRMTLECIPFSLNIAIEEVCAMAAPNAQAKKLELIASVDSSLDGEFLGDPLRVRQILLNLVGNAIKFTSNGWVLVSGRLEGENVVAEVKDTGIGIPPDRLDAIFDTFTQVDASTSRKFGGTGLGLSICRKLARMMGGDIVVSSALGEGTTFSVSIPLERSETETGPAPFAAPAGTRALVIDPVEPARRAMAKRLESFGIETAEASDADSALKTLRKTAGFRLAVLNVVTDETAAIEMLRRLEEVGGPELCLIALEPYSMSLRSNGLDIPRTFTVRKPWRVADLRKRLKLALSDSASGADTRSKTPSSQARFQRLKILVVDDNAINVKVMTRMIERTGAGFEVARNGEEAVQKSAGTAFDLILMDVHMPVMNGLDATRAIRAQEAASGRRSRIVALTANPDSDERQRCLSSGMDDFLVKPIPSDVLASLLLEVSSESERMAA